MARLTTVGPVIRERSRRQATPDCPEDETLSVRVAWWLLTGEARPSVETRFINAAPGGREVREHVAGQVEKLLSKAKAAGCRDELVAVLEALGNDD